MIKRRARQSDSRNCEERLLQTGLSMGDPAVFSSFENFCPAHLTLFKGCFPMV
jgi:hypothetical protein